MTKYLHAIGTNLIRNFKGLQPDKSLTSPLKCNLFNMYIYMGSVLYKITLYEEYEKIPNCTYCNHNVQQTCTMS